MRNHGGSILMMLRVKLWLLQGRVHGSEKEGVELWTVFVEMKGVALIG